MGKITMFNFLTVNGFFEGAQKGAIDWHKQVMGEEESDFSGKSLQSGNTLLFGRVTYEMMAGFWPTPQAAEMDPVTAKGMNEAEKIVFSRTLKKADWKNTRVIKASVVDEMKKRKQQSEKNMTILGSGSIVTLFAENDLIDEYQLMIDPVALGDGEPIFKGMKKQLDLRLTGTKVFKSGIVLLSYAQRNG